MLSRHNGNLRVGDSALYDLNLQWYVVIFSSFRSHVVWLDSALVLRAETAQAKTQSTACLHDTSWASDLSDPASCASNLLRHSHAQQLEVQGDLACLRAQTQTSKVEAA